LGTGGSGLKCRVKYLTDLRHPKNWAFPLQRGVIIQALNCFKIIGLTSNSWAIGSANLVSSDTKFDWGLVPRNSCASFVEIAGLHMLQLGEDRARCIIIYVRQQIKLRSFIAICKAADASRIVLLCL
jgi:hypothetical protein